MKTSNKIIALIFGLLILIPALVVATIIIKYRTGNFTRLDMKPALYTKTFPAIKNIKLRGLENLEIVPSDTLYAEIGTQEERQVKIETTGDAALIYGDTSFVVKDTAADHSVEERTVYLRNHNPVKLFLPATYALTLEECNIALTTDNKERMVDHYTLHLIRSNLDIPVNDSMGISFRKLTITSEQSDVKLNFNWDIEELDLDLKNRSNLYPYLSRINKLYVGLDSTSTIQLNGQQLKSVIQKK